MAIQRTEHGWHSTLTGRTETSREAAEHYEGLELAKRDGRAQAEAEDELTALPTETFNRLVKTLHAQAQRAADATDSVSLGVVNVWLRSRPEYINDEHNKGLLMYHMQKAQAWPPINPRQLDDAFVELSNAGLLHLNQKELDKQKTQREQAEADQFTADRELTPDEMAALPLEEIRKRAERYS